MDYTKLAEKLAKMGKDQVRLKLSQNAFQKRKVDFILWWLEHGEANIETTPEQVGEQTPVEELDTASDVDVTDYVKQLDADFEEIQDDMDKMINEAEASGDVTVIFDDQAAGDSVQEIVETDENVGVGEEAQGETTLGTGMSMAHIDEPVIPAEDVEPGGADPAEVEKTVADDSPSGEQASDTDSENTEDSGSEDTPE